MQSWGVDFPWKDRPQSFIIWCTCEEALHNYTLGKWTMFDLWQNIPHLSYCTHENKCISSFVGMLCKFVLLRCSSSVPFVKLHHVPGPCVSKHVLYIKSITIKLVFHQILHWKSCTQCHYNNFLPTPHILGQRIAHTNNATNLGRHFAVRWSPCWLIKPKSVQNFFQFMVNFFGIWERFLNLRLYESSVWAEQG